MKKLFYVRHGETQMNVAGLLSGQIETQLTEKGIGQAKAAGLELKLKQSRVDLIVCSPYERTYETAKLIANEVGYPIDKIQKSNRFIERNFGDRKSTRLNSSHG